MPRPYIRPPFSWLRKFGHAFRGVALGVRGARGFVVHLLAAAGTIGGAAALGCNLTEWCLLVLAIGGVLAAEMFNSSLERLAEAVSRDYNEAVRDALDIAAAAVLVAALTSAVLGSVVLGHRLYVYLVG